MNQSYILIIGLLFELSGVLILASEWWYSYTKRQEVWKSEAINLIQASEIKNEMIEEFIDFSLSQEEIGKMLDLVKGKSEKARLMKESKQFFNRRSLVLIGVALIVAGSILQMAGSWPTISN